MAEGGEAEQRKKVMKRILLIINCIILAIGQCGGPLILRLYFLHGGNSVWLSSFLQTAGFPILLIPLAISYIRRRRQMSTTPTKPKVIEIRLLMFVASAVLGLIVGVDDYLYSFGVARLPVSTSVLIVASQLAFTAVFAFFLVKQKFTAYSVNAVVLLTLASGVLALNASGDRPAGESNKKYVMGFIMTVLAAVLYGLFLPLVEVMYTRTGQAISYPLVAETQFVMSFTATLFCAIGMIADHNVFTAISTEARNFGLGETKYYVVLVSSAIIWQLGFLGANGVIFCSSSLFSGILVSALVPITEILSVVFYKEKFKAAKGVSLVLALWGFTSYFYGEFKQAKKMKRNSIREAELSQDPSIPNP